MICCPEAQSRRSSGSAGCSGSNQNTLSVSTQLNKVKKQRFITRKNAWEILSERTYETSERSRISKNDPKTYRVSSYSANQLLVKFQHWNQFIIINVSDRATQVIVAETSIYKTTNIQSKLDIRLIGSCFQIGELCRTNGINKTRLRNYNR